MKDRVLALMPEDFQFFLSAASVVQNYAMQLRNQIAGRSKPEGCNLVIDIGSEKNWYFEMLFPRMRPNPDISIVLGTRNLRRSDWDCVLDFRDLDRAFTIVRDSGKPLSEAWSIMFGCSALGLPLLGYLGILVHHEECDVIIDAALPEAEILQARFCTAFPQLLVRRMKVSGLRPGNIFHTLAKTRFYVGPCSDASRMAATMGKFYLEIVDAEGKWPLWWVANPVHQVSKSITNCASTTAVIRLMEEIWCGISGTKFQEKTPPASLPYTVASVGAK